MRIIKIIFNNLNSLKGKWTINLDHPEYESNGLFLITGPTGSGKTTLLDALCLGLYGRTPRIDSARESEELMTKNTAFCSSEVEFETSHGRFLARWQLRRANNSPRGKLQPPVHELAYADGKIITSKLSETRNLIPEYIGLDFEQFIRSALLAQNSFDIFLKADDEGKSSILEKLTDTSIYSQLSIKAYEKDKQEQEKLSALEMRKMDMDILSPEQIEEKKAAQNNAASRLHELGILKTGLMEQHAWLKNLEKLKAEKASLLREQAELLMEVKKFSPVKEKLDKARQCAQFEPTYQQLESSYNRKNANEKNRAAISEDIKIARNKQATLQKDLNAETAKKDSYSKKLAVMRPICGQVRIIDSRITEKCDYISKQEAFLKIKNSAFLETQEKLQKQNQDFKELEEQAKKLADWIGAHEGESLLKEKLFDFYQSYKRLQELKKDEKGLQASIQKIKSEYGDISQQNMDLQKQINEAQEQQKIIQAKIDAAAVETASLLSGWTLEGLKNSLKDKLLLAERYKSLAQHRKELQSGQPCPLCGSLEHPWKTQFISVYSRLDAETNELEQKIAHIENIATTMDSLEGDKRDSLHKSEIYTKQLEYYLKQADKLRQEINEKEKQFEDVKTSNIKIEKDLLSIADNFQAPKNLALAEIGAHLKQRAIAWEAAGNNLKKLDDKLHPLELSIAALSQNEINLAKEIKQAEEDIKQARKAMDKMREERDSLLPGQDPDKVEAELANLYEEAAACVETKKQQLENANAEINKLTGSLENAQRSYADLMREIASLQADLHKRLDASQISYDEFLNNRLPYEDRINLEKRDEDLTKRHTRLEALLKDINQRYEKAASQALTEQSENEIILQIKECDESIANLQEERAALAGELKMQAQKREELDELLKSIESQKKECKRWRNLAALIGSADGKKFRSFAQSITLDRLLAYANRQLEYINPRYTLIRAINQGPAKKGMQNLGLLVVDHFQAGEARGIKNLSGGETFMASLALALGLSHMAGKKARIDSLFLDEGFGALDSEALDMAFSAIGKLRQEGKLVGIISHVEAIKQWIPTRINVSPKANDPAHSVLSGPGCEGRCP